ncbi:MAG TPA: cation:proton antiporter [Geminicoccus sp.]|jgi:NhaP-type Na+/H+ or K+/H+ antiporter|uniref:cation:proton antiporter n=1 Tax=Geminicoccus sp. TaxID=2024832 RepID=UPI002E2F7AD4|nr:cation:proton antiporter [Geminicoccus sp.]HEX2529130.1 cation:proton antiporter [Geminicoccus sp.]
MNLYIGLLTVFGAIILLTAWLPMALREAPLSLPIISVGLGGLLFYHPALWELTPHPVQYPIATERLSELIVIISLMGAGLKLDRILSFRAWMPTWRLIGVAMPLTIAAVAFTAWGILGVSVAAALLLGAALAPTDPVLASDVQVGPPRAGEEDEARFTLTSEAGLNDGFAFPFVNLAIALALAGGHLTAEGWRDWFLVEVLWEILGGVAVGWAIGWGLGYITFRMPNRTKLAKTGDGFIALGATFLAYGLSEALNIYGFLAVFVAALAIRAAERNHDFHDKLHDFAEQTERMLMMVLLVLFGAMVVHGGLLAPINLPIVVFALVTIFLIRPGIGMLSLVGVRMPTDEKLTISFFGIRGMGSIYYLAYGLNHAEFDQTFQLWAALSLVVLISILLHGTTVTPAMGHLDRRRSRNQRRQEVPAPAE